MTDRRSIFAWAALLALVQATSGQARPQDAHPTPAEKGLVFLDGAYLPPPYDVRVVDKRVTINGRPASELPQEITSRNEGPPANFHGNPERRGPRGPGDRGPGERGRREFGPPPFPREGEANSVRDQLNAGAILVYFPGRPHVLLNNSRERELLLQCFADGADRAEHIEELVSAPGTQIDRERWQTWLRDFTPPRPLVALAEAELAEMQRLDQAGRDAFHSQLRLRALAYPLTVVGMILAVFSLGHLLQSPPDNRVRPQSTRRCARHCRAAVVSLVLIGLLSALDLTWTLLASQAGQMTELNPIGSQMIDHPTMLSALKVGSTLLSCGVLMLIRRHPRAQLATWWLCLVCTVLTFRWLVLNSMFVV